MAVRLVKHGDSPSSLSAAKDGVVRIVLLLLLLAVAVVHSDSLVGAGVGSAARRRVMGCRLPAS